MSSGHGGHGGGSWHGGGSHGHGDHGHHHFYGYYPFFGYGFGYPGYWGGYGDYGYYGSSSYYPGYANSYYWDNDVWYGPNGGGYDSYYGNMPAVDAAWPRSPAPTPEDPNAVVEDDAIHIRVRVPADAQVWFENEKTTLTGAERYFDSPAVTPGKNYTYSIRASWMDNGREVSRTRKIPVHAGEKVTVDFLRPIQEKLQTMPRALE
jgi:uncharacterized protein (TIGR03000 family)